MEKKSQKDRMRELVESFSNKEEIFEKKTTMPVINEKVLKDECKTLYKRATGSVNEDYYTASGGAYGGGSAGGMGFGGGSKVYGKKVGNIADDFFGNSGVSYRPIRQPLKDDEALNIAILRTNQSGAPVNKMEYYEEVNFNLNNLGFPSKSPIDIKNAITKLVTTGQ